MHATVDSTNCENAWLRFMPEKSESQNDGKLQAYELYNIRLNADLGYSVPATPNWAGSTGAKALQAWEAPLSTMEQGVFC